MTYYTSKLLSNLITSKPVGAIYFPSFRLLNILLQQKEEEEAAAVFNVYWLVIIMSRSANKV